MTIRERYNKAYSLYLRAARGMEHRHDIEIKRRGRVKRPTMASIRALEREREKLRAHRWVEVAPTVQVQTVPDILPDLVETDKTEDSRAAVELEKLTDLINEGLEYSGRKVSSNAMIHAAAMEIDDILSKALKQMSPSDIMGRLHGLWGDMSQIVTMIETLIYAVYNLHGSGFAKWSGRGARNRWSAKVKEIEAALL